MPTHHRESVIAAVEGKLANIADGDSKWAMDHPPLIQRFRGIGLNAQQYPILYMITAGETKKRIGSSGIRTIYDSLLTLTLEVWIETEDLDVEISKVIHDVELALGEDHTQGGVVIDTEVTGNQTFVPEDSEGEGKGGCFIDVVLHYRYQDNRPDAPK